LRLDPAFRYALYAAFAVLFVTGAVWLVADSLKEADSEFWQQAAATLLMLHGGGAMVTLMMLGALVPVHLRYGWRKRKNLMTGITVATVNVALIVTAFGLYYLGSEAVRPWMSDVHTVLGLAIPALLVAHIWWGRRGTDRMTG
jgi:Na+/H+ antiporter NhaC